MVKRFILDKDNPQFSKFRIEEKDLSLSILSIKQEDAIAPRLWLQILQQSPSSSRSASMAPAASAFCSLRSRFQPPDAPPRGVSDSEVVHEAVALWRRCRARVAGLRPDASSSSPTAPTAPCSLPLSRSLSRSIQTHNVATAGRAYLDEVFCTRTSTVGMACIRAAAFFAWARLPRPLAARSAAA